MQNKKISMETINELIKLRKDKAKARHMIFKKELIEDARNSTQEVDEKIKNSYLAYGIDIDKFKEENGIVLKTDDFLLDDEANSVKMYDEYMSEYKKNMVDTTQMYLSTHKLNSIEKANLESQKTEKLKMQITCKVLKKEIMTQAILQEPNQEEAITHFNTKATSIIEKMKQAENAGELEKLEEYKNEYNGIKETGIKILGGKYSEYTAVSKKLVDAKFKRKELEETINKMDENIKNVETDAKTKVNDLANVVEEAEIEAGNEVPRIKIGDFIKVFGKEALVNLTKKIAIGATVGAILPSGIEDFILEKITAKIIKCDMKISPGAMEKLIKQEKELINAQDKYIKAEEKFVEGDIKENKKELGEVIYNGKELQDIKEDKIYGLDENLERAVKFGANKANDISLDANPEEFEKAKEKNERDLEDIR